MVTAGDTRKPVLMGRRLRGRDEEEVEEAEEVEEEKEGGAAAVGPRVKEA